MLATLLVSLCFSSSSHHFGSSCSIVAGAGGEAVLLRSGGDEIFQQKHFQRTVLQLAGRSPMKRRCFAPSLLPLAYHKWDGGHIISYNIFFSVANTTKDFPRRMLKVLDRGVASKGAKKGPGESKGGKIAFSYSSMDEISLWQNSIQCPVETVNRSQNERLTMQN